MTGQLQAQLKASAGVWSPSYIEANPAFYRINLRCHLHSAFLGELSVGIVSQENQSPKKNFGDGGFISLGSTGGSRQGYA